jgi:hypothetical protein
MDIGSESAYSTTIFMLCLIFSAVLPMINILGFIFFTLKYLAFKYHMIYVYNQEFEAKGKIRNANIPLLIFAIIFA